MAGRADVNMCMTDGTTPLMLAAEHGAHSVVARLLEAGACIDQVDHGPDPDHGLDPDPDSDSDPESDPNPN